MNQPLIFTLVAFLVVAGAFVCLIISRHMAEERDERFRLKRHDQNPIKSPARIRDWEIVGTFNSAALKDKSGRVHLIYRAIGADGISRLGYAESNDGATIDYQSQYPVFSMMRPRIDKGEVAQKHFNPVMYPSGGSWGGAEDPRMVEIGGRIYVTFNAFDGWDYVRIGVISIDEKKFLKHEWAWSEPFLISPPGQINKNWVMFPEKIDGKFAILHSISPEVQIDYVDFLEELGSGRKTIQSKFGQNKPREGWDSWVRGAGPPPLRTDKGWLVLYHAMDKRHPQIGYKLGALLLDLHNPKKVIARSPSAILSPDKWYENDWKAGVVYSCGSIIKDGDLVVYYGGGDKHLCVAKTPLAPLLDWLVRYGKVS